MVARSASPKPAAAASIEKPTRPRRQAKSEALPDTGAPAQPAQPTKAQAPRMTQAERRATAERRILDAALELVALRGSTRMTLAEVGEAAGYSRGLPAHRFGNKAGLLKMLVMNIGARFEARRLTLPTRRPGLDALRGVVSAYLEREDDRWIETRALLVMMTEGFMEDSELNPYIGEYIRNSLTRLEQHVRDGIALGEIRADADPTAVAALLIGGLRGVLHQRLVLGGELDLRRVQNLALQMIDRTLTAP